MKKLFILSITLACVCIAAKANRINLNTSRGSNSGYYISPGFNYAPGDTFVLSGSWSYCSMDHIIGTAARHVVFTNSGNLDMSAGFSFTACRYIDVVKSSSGYFKIHDDAFKSNVGITITGLSHVIKIDNIEIYNKLYGMWVKWESNQTGCDSTQWYPNTIDSVTIINNSIYNVNQEGIYAGSTDPDGTAKERTINCYGINAPRRSAPIKDIFIEYNNIYNTGRTNIQLSAATFGKYRINHNTLRNAGFETSLTQWPNIWIGGESQAEGEIAWNTGDSASRNNITCYGSKPNIHNNTFAHAGIARDINTGTIYRFNYYGSLIISIRTTNPYAKTCFKIKDNNFTPSFNNSSVYIEGAAKDYSDTGNFICNSGTKGFQDANVKYTDGCNGGDTSFKTVKVPCDTPKVAHYPDVFGMRDSVIFNLDHRDTAYFTPGNRYKIRVYGDTEHVKIPYLIRAAYDDTIICSKCGSCDSAVYDVANTTTSWGAIIANSTQSQTEATLTAAGLNLVRIPVYFSNNPVSNALDKYLSDGFLVQVNLNWQPTSSPVPFPTDTALIRIKAELFFSHYALYKSQIPFVACENEWNNLPFLYNNAYHSNSFLYYIAELKIVTDVAHKYGFKIADAGITSDALQRWTYSQLNGAEASDWAGKYGVGLQNNYQALCDTINAYAAAVHDIPIDYLNTHWYNATTCRNGFNIAQSKYMTACNKTKTVNNEFGIKTDSETLWTQTRDELKGYIIYGIAYSGINELGKAITLSVEFLSLLK